MDIADKMACAEVIQAWGFARDQGRWDDLAAIFHPGGEIAVSWFRGPYPEFVAHCQRNFGRGSEAKHLLWPARVAVNGARATAETNVAILVRQTIEGVAVDLTSNGRFLDRLERRDGVWRIVERAALYEKDRLDPVEPSADVRRDDGEVRRREISGAISLHGLSRARRRPHARRAGALRRPRRDRGAQGALRGVARGKVSGGRPCPAFAPARDDADCVLQLILDLVEAGLHAGLVLLAARRAGDAGRADHVVADLDRQRAARRW